MKHLNTIHINSIPRGITLTKATTSANVISWLERATNNQELGCPLNGQHILKLSRAQHTRHFSVADKQGILDFISSRFNLTI